MHPGEEAFDFPASSVAPQWSSILGLLFAVAAVGRDPFHAVFVSHLLIERGRVVGLVADQSMG
jgi:hypothetical protein